MFVEQASQQGGNAMSQVKVLIGGEGFAEIRQEKYYYVDKTAFLERYGNS